MGKYRVSSGVEYLDRFLDGLNFGDNLVWEVEAGTYINVFVDKFIEEAQRSGNFVVYASFNKSPMTINKILDPDLKYKKLLILDCFTAGKGGNDWTFNRFYEKKDNQFIKRTIKIEDPKDFSLFKENIAKIEEEKGEGTRYVFDSLTGMQDLWENERKTYKFFTYSCPRLYDLKTVAYWILEKEAHSKSFIANLNHITQVIIDLSCQDHQLYLNILKAEGRASRDLFTPKRYEVWDNEIIFPVERKKEIIDLGGKVKNLREKRELSQRALAEKINVSASFISQLERNLISPSLSTLLQLCSVLNVDPVYFFSEEVKNEQEFIMRKKERKVFPLPGIDNDIVKIQSLGHKIGDRKMEPYVVTIEPGAEVKRHIFLRKGDEFVYVIRGEVEIELGEKKYILREGDSLYLNTEFPRSWKNISDVETLLIWVIL